MDTLQQQKTPHRAPISTPDLRIVPTDQLVPHELHDSQRSDPLIEKLRVEGILKNPPIVANPPSDDEVYIVLDGANRALALAALEVPHTLVQAVSYDSDAVELLTWYHVVSELEPSRLESRLRQISQLEVHETNVMHAKAELARRAILAHCLFADGRVITLSGGGLNLNQRTQLLHAIVNAYIHEGRLDRTNTDNLAELHATYPRMTAAIIFPRFEPVEVMDLAQGGLKVPPGLTRHIIHGRALRLNYPLDKLREDKTLDEKNRELQEWVQACFQFRRVRYYAESTYLFDE